PAPAGPPTPLPLLTQIQPRHRVILRHQRPQPGPPPVPPPVTPGDPATLAHERPPACAWDTKPEHRTRRTFLSQPLTTEQPPPSFIPLLRPRGDHPLGRRA